MVVGVDCKLHLVQPCQVCGRSYSAPFNVWLPTIMCCGLPLSLVQIEVQDGTTIGTGADDIRATVIGTSADEPHVVEGGS